MALAARSDSDFSPKRALNVKETRLDQPLDPCLMGSNMTCTQSKPCPSVRTQNGLKAKDRLYPPLTAVKNALLEGGVVVSTMISNSDELKRLFEETNFQ